MDINEVHKLKREMCEKIRDVIANFEEVATLCVSGINLLHMHSFPRPGNKTSIVSQVEAEISL